MRRQRLIVLFVLGLLVGCGRPVVDPRGPGPVTAPTIPSTGETNSSGLPTLQTPDIQPVPTESVIQLPHESLNETYHTVQAGETLTSVSKRYGVSVERLRSANGLDSSAQLQSQQLLFIPKDR